MHIFGDDYPTPDGTCVRDYIHVTDLADAHLRALALQARPAPRLQPRQRGGFSVRQVIEVCREVSGADIGTDVDPRRPGDPAVLVASSEKIQSELGWRAEKDLRAMAADAWAVHPARSRTLRGGEGGPGDGPRERAEASRASSEGGELFELQFGSEPDGCGWPRGGPT